MRKIDNFNKIANFINFSYSDFLFVMVQIVRCQKDHPNEKVGESSVRTYYIRSREQFERLEDEMRLIADFHGARVYVNVSPKSVKKLQENVLTELLRKQIAGEIDNPEHVTKSIAGQLKSKQPLWIIDVDDEADFAPIIAWLNKNDRSDYEFIPTFSYGHILVKPFNKMEFSKAFPKIDLHENSMGTLAYANI